MTASDRHPPPEALEVDEPSAEVARHLAACPVCRIDRRLLREPLPAGSLEGLEGSRRRAALVQAVGFARALSSWSSTRGEDGDDGGPSALEPGALIGDYQVERRVGRGGMGVVYPARHRDHGTRHALKVLRPEHANARRLAREGRLQAGVRHPNVVGVVEVIELQGSPALVLDWVGGPSLDRLVELGPLPVDVVDAVAVDLLCGLDAAHRAGLIHRDLKPANVLLAPGEGRASARLGDFGLARGAPGGDSLSTRSGVVVGTLASMAPEQLRGEPVDARTDVYGAGALLWELLTGHPPRPGEPAADPLPAEVPERMALALRAALRADPADRPADAGALCAAWLAGLDPDAVRARPWPEAVLARIAASTPEVDGPPPFSGPVPGRREVPEEGEAPIGRARELARLRAAVDAGATLVTVTGPAGAGKSRVALHVARTVIGEAVWFAPPGPAELPLVRRILDAVDRLPAGIELVASRAGVLSLGELARRLEQGRLRLTAAGRRPEGARVASDAVWEGLDEEERDALARLSTFSCAFALEDAEAVLPPDRDVPDLLQRLLDHCTLRRKEDRTPHFACYRAVRERAEQALAAGGLADDARRAFVRRFASFGDPPALDRTTGPGGAGPWADLRARAPDLERAVRWALDLSLASEAARAWCALHLVIERVGPLDELVALGERVLAAEGLPPELDSRVRSRLVDACAGTGNAVRAFALLEAARPGDDASRSVVAVQRGDLLLHQGRLAEATAELERAVGLAEASGDPLLLGNALRVLGVVRSEGLDLDGAIRVGLAALSAYERAGDEVRSAYVRVNLGCDLGESGRIDEAERELLAALDTLQRVGDARRAVQVIRNLGSVALARGTCSAPSGAPARRWTGRGTRGSSSWRPRRRSPPRTCWCRSGGSTRRRGSPPRRPRGSAGEGWTA